MRVQVLFTILISLFMTNCFFTYGQVKVTEDSYKNSTIVTVDLKHQSTEFRKSLFYSLYSYAAISYIKEIKKGKPVLLKLVVKIYGNLIKAGSLLENKGFVKINGKQISVKLAKIDSSSSTSSSTTSSTDYSGSGKSAYTDYTKPQGNDFGTNNYGRSNHGGGSTKTTTRTATVHYALAEIELSTKELKKLENCEELEMRFYVNSLPMTFTVAEKELDILKKFAATTEAETE
ncbi:MAG: hypothetical protein ABUK01_04805 [Leptospirales bacterium]